MTFSEIVIRYLETPSRESFDTLRIAVRRAPNYTPDFHAESVASAHIQRGNYSEAITRLGGFMPGAFMSPGAHSLLAFAHRQLGKLQQAEREETLARAALQGIFGSGDGTEVQPWQVLRISDEYDILRVLGKRSERQTVARKVGRLYDQHLCTDGSEIWFDLSLLYSRVGQHEG